ncbi:GntR family transcriptional regulator [Pseudaquabacterium rugosum]|uniref:GntR family transcriptional regulator n=1 Tax=Pseudaquabacterium rugosum TaxID=2984194 RepID=A0ABU9B7T3_9BURK
MAKPAAEDSGQDKVRETSATRVYVVLRNEILTMKLPPGAALDEAGLAERFDMSRSPIREALARLSAEGLITTLANRTTMVAPMDFARVPEFLDALDLLQRVTTRLAALHRTQDDLVRIREAQKAYERGIATSLKTGDSLPMIEMNYEFHMTIARTGRNAYFEELYRRLLEEGRRMLHLHFEYKASEPDVNVQEMASDHTEIVRAIEMRDADRAERFAHEHAEQFKGRFMEFLDRNITAGIPLTYSPGSRER